MGALDQLPNELKYAIVAYLDDRSLDCLSRTCHALRSVTIPVLYHTITMSFEPHASRKITSLLRTLLEKPSLCRHVKELVFCTKSFPRYHDLEPKERDLFAKAIVDSNYAEPEKWKEAIFTHRLNQPIMTLILARCAFAEAWSIDIDFLLRQNFLSQDLEQVLGQSQARDQRSRFEKLKHVTIHYDSRYVFSYLSQTAELANLFLLLFYLPHVQTLDLSLVSDHPIHQRQQPHVAVSWPLPNPPIAATLNTLRLRQSPMSPVTLSALLKQTPNLTTLVYEIFVPSSETPLDLDRLRSALAYVSSTLTHLAVRYDVYADEDLDLEYLAELCAGSMGSLRDLTALATLEISLPVLYGQDPQVDAPSLAEVLPPNLSKLTITDDLWDFSAVSYWSEGGTIAALSMFLTGIEANEDWQAGGTNVQDSVIRTHEPGWADATPHLKELVFDMQTRGNYDYRTRLFTLLERLRARCEEQNLSCAIFSR